MNPEKRKQVERATLKTFQEEIPSIYFSDGSERDFREYSENAFYTYRDLFKFPPKMFADANLIDFGAGSGENTISLALWGAHCTLVEMNEKALSIAKQIFARYAPRGKHQFIQASIFDHDSPIKYDIVHCRGVLSHTADKEGAFKKIAGFLKPGGFLIFGDPNKAGGFQNMLQRYAIYRHARTWDEMVDLCEKLFKEDIDRSQRFRHRTRRAIIFDRWIIQSQDDPSVEEVLSWMSDCNLKLYSSYPPFILPLIGDSVHHMPRLNSETTQGMASIAETVWMLQKDGDVENVKMLEDNHRQFSEALSTLTGYVANFNSTSTLDTAHFDKLAGNVATCFENLSFFKPLAKRLSAFMEEAKAFVHKVDTSDLDGIRKYIVSCKHLFKGACGVRHVDFIAYRPETRTPRTKKGRKK